MFENTVQNIALGLGVGVLVSDFFIWLFLKVLRWSVNIHEEKETEVRAGSHTLERSCKVCVGDWFIEHLTGWLERMIYIVLLVTNIAAAGAFIGTWLLVKVGVGWNVRQAWVKKQIKEHEDEWGKYAEKMMRIFTRRLFISFQGSLVSVLCALGGAYLWCPEAFK